MDQTPPFQSYFNMDYFPPLQLPPGQMLSDPLDVPRHRGSFSELENPFYRNKPPTHTDHIDMSYIDNASFYLHQREDDMYHEQFTAHRPDNIAKNWPGYQTHGFLDATLEPWFGSKEKDFALEPYQMTRSRGGSFNFGTMRKESEDFFHLNSDFFKHIRNITDMKPSLENNLNNSKVKQSLDIKALGKSVNNQPHDNNSPKFNTDTSKPIVENMNQSQTNQNQNLINSNIEVKLEASSSIKDKGTINEDIQTQAAKKKGRKKRLLNDGTEVATEGTKPGEKIIGKAGRPKKNKDKNEKIEEDLCPKKKVVKTQIHKKQKQDTENADSKQDKDDKSTEASSSGTSKLEDSPNCLKPKVTLMPDILRMQTPESLKEILGGINLPNDVKEYLQNSNWMGQEFRLETKKIGTLTVAERRVKVEKYLQKRKKRSWSRRINYDCRKRVADSRLRIKGRFVTRDQAFILMEEAGIKFDPETITNPEIKTLLTEKFGGSTLKKKNLNNEGTTLHLKRPSEKELDESDLEDDEERDSNASE